MYEINSFSAVGLLCVSVVCSHDSFLTASVDVNTGDDRGTSRTEFGEGDVNAICPPRFSKSAA